MITQRPQRLPLTYVMIVPALTADISMHNYIYIYVYFIIKDGGKKELRKHKDVPEINVVL